MKNIYLNFTLHNMILYINNSMKNAFNCILILISFCRLSAQTNISGIINSYTPIVAFNICNNSVTVINATSLSVGDRVMIIQMKGAAINQSNTASFGSVTNIGSAGLYEFGNIRTITGNEVSFVNLLVNNYDVSGRIQLIKVPQYNDAIINAELTAASWDGEKGGVLAFEVSGTLTFNANINANGKGFRGGLPSGNFYSSSACSRQDYFFLPNQQFGGFKGEGVTEIPSNMHTGKGRLANGGGGGNHVNSGGAGGANIVNGGNGGNEWSGCSNTSIGGVGGGALNGASSRIFLGGGGGGGQQNDNVATSGGNGGGIIIVRANQIIGNAASILCNGNSVQATSGNDGAGGGGAGGTIILDVNSVSLNLNVNANGGKGGDTNNGPYPFQCHGTGGGGSGGVLYYTNSGILNNLFIQKNGGNFGTNVSSQSPCFNTAYGAEAGQNGIQQIALTIPEGSLLWEPTLQFTLNKIEESCRGLNNAEINIQVSGNSPPYTISWSNGQADFLMSNLSPGNYSFTIADANNCNYVDIVEIQPSETCCNMLVDVESTPADCNISNGSITFLPNPNNVITGIEYSIDSGTTFLSNQSFNNLPADTYSTVIRYTDKCELNQTVIISEPQNDIEVSIIATNASCSGLSDGNAQIIALNGSNGPFNLFWSNGINDSLTIRNLSAGTYTLHVTDQIDCSLISSIQIGEPSPIIINLSETMILCSAATVEINAGNNGSSFLWSNGSTQQSINVDIPDIYSVTVTNNNGCKASDSVYVIENQFYINAGADTIISEWDSIHLQVTINDNSLSGTIEWTPSEYLSCSDCKNPLITTFTSSEFIITYIDTNGCKISDTVFVKVIPGEYYFYMPNAFSPNHDGNNDFLFPVTSGVKQLTWRIWDRWGEKVFECTTGTIPCYWDGTFKDNECNPGVYVWDAVIKSKRPDIKKYKGSVVLIK